jgi:Fic family protein
VYPTRKLAAAALQTLCEVVNAWAYKESRHDPLDRVDAVMRIFALAAFAQYHFVEIHSFFDGNGRLSRYVALRWSRILLCIAYFN